MGTRADFYIGHGASAEWVGSIAWDGYPEGLPDSLKKSSSLDEFRSELEKFFSGRSDVTLPAMGWPWPWEDSKTTDFAYCFFDGRVWASSWGKEFFLADDPEPEIGGNKKLDWPDFSGKQNVTLGTRSGLIVITGG